MATRNGIRHSVSSEAADPEDRMQPGITSSILAAIGRTPLIRLRQLARDVPAQVLVKLEALNPGGSIKDRVGVAMVAEAERRDGFGRAERSLRPPPAIPASVSPWRPR